MRGFDAAQRAYDNMLPPEDGPCECPICDGKGLVLMGGDPDGDYVKCNDCAGHGWLLDGEPFDREKAECDAEDRADHKRDEKPIWRR